MSAQRIVHIKPASGRLVVCPETERPLLSSGESRELSPHWKRREREGDVTISQVKATKKPTAEASQ